MNIALYREELLRTVWEYVHGLVQNTETNAHVHLKTCIAEVAYLTSPVEKLESEMLIVQKKKKWML